MIFIFNFNFYLAFTELTFSHSSFLPSLNLFNFDWSLILQYPFFLIYFWLVFSSSRRKWRNVVGDPNEKGAIDLTSATALGIGSQERWVHYKRKCLPRIFPRHIVRYHSRSFNVKDFYWKKKWMISSDPWLLNNWRCCADGQSYIALILAYLHVSPNDANFAVLVPRGHRG